MKITIGITTYNRLDYLKKMAASLRCTVGLEHCNIRIYDDCSTQYTVEHLSDLFPSVTEIRRRPHNLGADGNIRQMYLDFLETNDDVLVNCDSDMIFRSDWVCIVQKLLPETDGILSIYNSVLHGAADTFAVSGIRVVRKTDIGSAGTAFSREILSTILQNVAASRTYDWDWSKYLTSRGFKLLVTEDSFAQHIGLTGYNSDAGEHVDFGLNFYPLDLQTLRYDVNFLEELIRLKQKVIERHSSAYVTINRKKLLHSLVECMPFRRIG